MAQIVIINSVNNAAGKTTLTAHLAVMLAAEYKSAVLDNAGENSALAMFVAKRYNLNLGKNYHLIVPPYYSLQKEKFDESYLAFKNHISHGNCVKFGYELDQMVNGILEERDL